MKILKITDLAFSKNFDRLLRRDLPSFKKIEKTVRDILENVRKRGDRALFAYTQKFDGWTPTSKTIEVSPREIAQAFRRVGREAFRSLELAAKRIERFHRIQGDRFFHPWMIRKDGIRLGEIIRPIERVGIYVPGGLAAYPSTVLMNTIPARVAGVREIVMVSPAKDGLLNPYSLVAAQMAGVNRIFKVGGAQGIAALAFGTKSIPAVDKIVGPGNIYVATAKKMVFGTVGIDMVAGPTEIVVVADDTANPAYVASDLLSQAEHDPMAVPILLSPSPRLIKSVLRELEKQITSLPRREILKKALAGQGTCILTKNTLEAIELSNRIAPEHLSLQIRNPQKALTRIHHAGAIFLGPYSPVALGDYLAGPNHVLPTARSARFSSPLGVVDFLKRSSIIEASPQALKKLGPHVSRLARLESLTAHAASVDIRLSHGKR